METRNALSCSASQVFSSLVPSPFVLGGSAASIGFLVMRSQRTASLSALSPPTTIMVVEFIKVFFAVTRRRVFG